MTVAQSPLFEPVVWDDGGFRILDETRVPESIEYLAVREVAHALDAVRTMKTRAFGQVLAFLYAGALLAQKNATAEPAELGRLLDAMTEHFCAARPTFDFRGLRAFFDAWLNELPLGSRAGDLIAKQAREFGQRLVRGRTVRARLAASALPNPARVLTHCNVSGELVEVARYCRELGKEISVIATETRPYLQGTRLTAWELAQAGVPVSVIPDNAIAQVMEHAETNAVIVGADRTAQNGDIINKVGTYPLALMARDFGIPFFALVQDPRSLTTGDEVPIEERPAAELLEFQGMSLIRARSGEVRVRYPAFDMTPAALITRWIGFDDIYSAETFRRKFQTRAAPRCPVKGRGQYLLIYGLPPDDQLAFINRALAVERSETVLIPEMRPELWGAALVAPALIERGIPTTLISDGMMGTLFAQKAISKVCLFYDDLTEQGPKAICGAQLVARLAHSHGVQIELFQAAGHRPSTLDRDAGTFLGLPICPPEATIHAVGAEVVPWPLLKTET